MINCSYSYDVIADAVIGFIDAPYAANENGIAAIKIGVVSGRLQREVLVDFSVFSGSAVGK